MTPLVAVLACLATYRAALIVSADTITEPIRSRFIHWAYKREAAGAPDVPKRKNGGPITWDEFARHDPDPPKLVAGVICPWCVSWWLAIPVAVTAWHWGHTATWTVIALALAASGVTGLLASIASPAD